MLAGLDPPGALTGGAALAGFHCRHRPTRDLVLFWHGPGELGRISEDVLAALRRAVFGVESLQRTPAFHRLRVSGDGDTVLVDLVADSVETAEAPEYMELGDTRALVDTPHEVLVNKLCAILSRSEVRDLVDLRELLTQGDLKKGLTDAARKDGGFSPLTLVWVLHGLPLGELMNDLDPVLGEGLPEFRDELVERVTRFAAPDDPDTSP